MALPVPVANLTARRFPNGVPPLPTSVVPAGTAGRFPNGTPPPLPVSVVPPGQDRRTTTTMAPDGKPTINPDMPFLHPNYTGSDPAYAAWLAGANQQQADAIAQAKMRRAQLNDAYHQALADLDRSAVQGRRDIQTGMLSRGMFRSGETDRRGQEYDTLIDQAQKRANATLAQQIGDVDIAQQNTMSRLATDAAAQYSAAMQRDALAAYQAQQEAASAAPAATTAAPAFAAPQQSYAPSPKPSPAATPSYLKPTTNQAGVDPRFVKPAAPAKPKVASGSTGQLKQKKIGGLQ